MFGSGGNESGSFFGGAEDKTGGSFFGAGPSAGEGGGASFFGSGGFGTPSKSEDQKPPTSFYGPPPDLSVSTTPAKRMKGDTTTSQTSWSNPSSSTGMTGHQSKQPAGPSPNSLTANWGAPPATRPGVNEDYKSQGYGHIQAQGQNQEAPQSQMYKQDSTGVAMTSSKPQEFRQAQPQGYSQGPPQFKQGPTSLAHPPASSQGSSQALTQPQGYGQAPPPTQEHKKEASAPVAAKQQNLSSSDQSSVLKEEKIKANLDDKTKDDEGDDIPADALLKELIEMQKQHLTEFLPELRYGEDKAAQILDSAGLVLKDVTNYSEKLSGIKQQYCSRLSQVSSFLRMIPKTEK